MSYAVLGIGALCFLAVYILLMIVISIYVKKNSTRAEQSQNQTFYFPLYT